MLHKAVSPIYEAFLFTQEKEGHAMEVKYELVKQTLRQEIISGKYQINEKSPTESQLMARFNVSRYTIRRAVGELENEHYIYRVQGGMFVQDWQRHWSADDANKLVGVISTHMADYIFHRLSRKLTASSRKRAIR